MYSHGLCQHWADTLKGGQVMLEPKRGFYLSELSGWLTCLGMISIRQEMGI